ncbi:MAG: Crp/Fnr family transcriptional regulator [Acidimicrobiales bacterium]
MSIHGTDEVLELCEGLPRRSFEPGEVLLAQGPATDRMYVVIEGCVEVRRNGVAVATVTEPGSFLGEIAALLGRGHTADVVAAGPTSVFVVADAARALDEHPALVRAVARVLATRLDAMTGYLADIGRTYGEASGHLGLVHTVLGELLSARPLAVEPGSARHDVPDY